MITSQKIFILIIFSSGFKRCVSFSIRSDQCTQCLFPKIFLNASLKIVQIFDQIIWKKCIWFVLTLGKAFLCFLTSLFFLSFWRILTRALHLKALSIPERGKPSGAADTQQSARPCDCSLLFSPTVQHRLPDFSWEVLRPCQF